MNYPFPYTNGVFLYTNEKFYCCRFRYQAHKNMIWNSSKLVIFQKELFVFFLSRCYKLVYSIKDYRKNKKKHGDTGTLPY